MKRPPNILFLMSDEHRASVSGYEGNAVVGTPTLDALAREGVTFRNAYTPSPICVPGRQAIMSGQFPSTNGCRNYGEDLAPDYMTWARRFSQFAYQTVACGKLHHTGVDPAQGWNKLIGMSGGLASQYIPDRDVAAFERYRQVSMTWDWQKEVQRAGVGRARNAVHDEYTVEGALNFIEEYFCDPYYDRATPDRPLVLKVSLEQPHYPFLTDEARFNYYLNRVETWTDQTPFPHPFLGRESLLEGGVEGVCAREIRRATAAYYGMVEQTDAHFGRVMEALRHAGQNLDDWILVYTSDHGEMLGEKSLWGKQKFFEASARVPLIIRWPKRFAPRVVEQNVNLCDLFATLCELCELPVPDGLDSRSLVPLLSGQNADWNDESISQFGTNNLMIKRGALKYSCYGPQTPEVLFDLERDPTETANFLDEARYGSAVSDFRARARELGYAPQIKP